jgi:hypothetical protein
VAPTAAVDFEEEGNEEEVGVEAWLAGGGRRAASGSERPWESLGLTSVRQPSEESWARQEVKKNNYSSVRIVKTSVGVANVGRTILSMLSSTPLVRHEGCRLVAIGPCNAKQAIRVESSSDANSGCSMSSRGAACS